VYGVTVRLRRSAPGPLDADELAALLTTAFDQHPLVEHCRVRPATGEVDAVVYVVADDLDGAERGAARVWQGGVGLDPLAVGWALTSCNVELVSPIAELALLPQAD